MIKVKAIINKNKTEIKREVLITAPPAKWI